MPWQQEAAAQAWMVSPAARAQGVLTLQMVPAQQQLQETHSSQSPAMHQAAPAVSSQQQMAAHLVLMWEAAGAALGSRVALVTWRSNYQSFSFSWQCCRTD